MPLRTLIHRSGWFFLLLVVFGITAVSGQEAPSKIFFLHLKMESNRVSLVNASVAPGKLKPASARRPSLELVVATADGQVLWTNTVANPSIRHLEYEDPDHPGEILSKEVQVTNIEFTVRVPAFEKAHQVDFYLPHSPSGTNALTKDGSTAARGPSQRTRLGAVVLPEQLK